MTGERTDPPAGVEGLKGALCAIERIAKAGKLYPRDVNTQAYALIACEEVAYRARMIYASEMQEAEQPATEKRAPK